MLHIEYHNLGVYHSRHRLSVYVKLPVQLLHVAQLIRYFFYVLVASKITFKLFINWQNVSTTHKLPRVALKYVCSFLSYSFRLRTRLILIWWISTMVQRQNYHIKTIIYFIQIGRPHFYQ